MASTSIPIGPQHPALKEPESFLISLNGERIIDVGVRLGYNHRGIEKACENRTYIQDIYLIERVCGICSHSHSTAFIQAVEEIAGLEVPPRAKYIRTLVGELERVHSHLLWLGVAGHEIGFDTLLMYSWRDREIVMDILAMLTGNRVNYGDEHHRRRPARHRRGPEAARSSRRVDVLEERTKYYIEVATHGDHADPAALAASATSRKEDVVTSAPSARPAAPPASTATSARTTPTPPTPSSTSRSSPTTTATSTAAPSSASAS